MHKFARRFLAIAALTIGGLAWTGAPATANPGTVECPATNLQTNTQRACVYWELPNKGGSRGIVYIRVSADRTRVSGWIHADPTQFSTATLYVQQCDGLGHNCGTINALACGVDSNLCRLIPPVTDVVGPDRPTAHGHTYRTCASFDIYPTQHAVNVCSPYFPV